MKAAFSAGISEQFGAAVGGCASALLNRGSCWVGARDAMISAGIQEATNQAFQYLMSGGDQQFAQKRLEPYDAAARTDRGGTFELADACVAGQGGACQALRAANEADLAEARKFLKDKYPDLSPYAPAAVVWNDSPEYKREYAGDVNRWTGAMTLSSRYGSTAELVGTYAHETVHVYQVVTQTGTVAMPFLDAFFPFHATGTGWIHHQIHMWGYHVQNAEYPAWRRARDGS